MAPADSRLLVHSNMSLGIVNRLTRAIQKFQNAIDTIIFRGFPPEPMFAIDYGNAVNESRVKANRKPFSISDILGDGFLWAVPKRRRNYERRLMRRFGVPKYHWKPLVKKTNILMCTNCGHDYEAGTLCGHCYEKVKIVTKEMQDAIQEKLGLNPVEKDVIVIYEGERSNKSEEFWKSQEVVELPKKRPPWFSQNLLQGSTQEPSDAKEVKPTNLA